MTGFLQSKSDTVPDPGCVGLLIWAKRNPGKFFTAYHARLLPTRSGVGIEFPARGSNGDLDPFVDEILMDAMEETEAQLIRDGYELA